MAMVRKDALSHVIRIGLIVVAISMVTLFLDWLGMFQWPENMFYDNRMIRTASFHGPSDEIALVLLDQDSLDWGQQELGWSWPWPRSAYGDIVSFFNQCGAASVAFDVLFTEPSLYGAEDDQAFADACRDYGRVVQTVYFDQLHGNVTGWKEGFPLPPLIDDSLATLEFSDAEVGVDEGLLFPIDSIARSAAVLGNITGTSDRDKGIRRAKAYRSFDGYLIPTLGTASFFAAGLEGPNPATEPENGRLLRYQPSLNSYVPYSAGQILQSYYAIQSGQEPLLEPEMFQDMFVFFGFYAPGLFDICTTPVSAVYPGVGVHVTQLDNYLQDNFLHPAGFVLTVMLVVLLALLGVAPLSVTEILHLRKGGVLVSVVTLLLSAVVFVVTSYFVFVQGVVLPMMSPLVALFLAFVAAMVVSYLQEGRQRRYLKHAFRQYLSPAVIETLIAHPDRLALGGERRHISVYFSDVQGFTTISEGLEPEELTSLLNDYLSAMSDIILESGGTIDKYEGDAVIAFWNAPVEYQDHSRRAVEAMVCCQEKLAQMRPELEARAGRPFHMRIGVNTGDAVVGNMGSKSHFDYTMLGDSVNLAARLEGLNKQFGTYSMCSAATRDEALSWGTQLKFRELARVAVVGKKEAVTVFEPMTAEEYQQRYRILEVFAQSLQLFYRGKIKEVLEGFSSIRQMDSPAAHYVEKCQQLLDNPSDLDSWQGVWVATSK